MNLEQIDRAVEDLRQAWRSPLPSAQEALWREHLRHINHLDFDAALGWFIDQGTLGRPDVPRFVAQVRTMRPAVADTRTNEPWAQPDHASISAHMAELRRRADEGAAARRAARSAEATTC